MSPPFNFIRSLGGIRAVAAVLVVYFHFSYWLSPFAPPGADLFRLANAASYGMTLFFVLSGFVIHLTYSKWFERLAAPRAVLLFATARFARLYPLYLSFLVVWVVSHHGYLLRFLNDPEFRVFTLVHLLALQSWFPLMLDGKLSYNSVFNVSWSVSTEMFFYLVYPACFVALRKLSSAKQSALATLVFAMTMLFLLPLCARGFVPIGHQIERYWGMHPDGAANGVWEWLVYESPYFRLPEFLLGALAAHSYLQSNAVRPEVQSDLARYLPSTALVLIVALALLPEAYPTSGALKVLGRNFLLAPGFALLLYAIARPDNVIARILGSAGLVWLGEVSYSVYLLHPFIPRMIDVTYNAYPVTLASTTLYLANLAMGGFALAALSWGMYSLLEMPARRVLRRVGERAALGGA